MSSMARPELLPEAEARHVQRLEAVSSRPWFGLAWATIAALPLSGATCAHAHYR